MSKSTELPGSSAKPRTLAVAGSGRKQCPSTSRQFRESTSMTGDTKPRIQTRRIGNPNGRGDFVYWREDVKTPEPNPEEVEEDEVS
jgi:hypothetical protein